MGSIGSISNLNLGGQDYASLNAQRKRAEAETEGANAGNAQAAQNEQQDEQQNAVQARKEPAPEVTCPTAKEMPGIMAGLVSGIAQSPAWKLAEIQPAGKSKLVPAAYV